MQRLHEVAAGELAASGSSASSFQLEPFADHAGGGSGELPVLRKIESTGDHSPFFRSLPQQSKLLTTCATHSGSPQFIARSAQMWLP